MTSFPNNFKVQIYWGYEKYKFELKNSKVKKTPLPSYKCKYWLINKYAKKPLKHWTTRKHLKNIATANWLTNLSQLELEIWATMLGEFWLRSSLSLNKSWGVSIWVCWLIKFFSYELAT